MGKILFILTALMLAAAPAFAAEDYVDRMEREHAADEPVASPGAQAPLTAAVETSDVVYADLDGTKVTGYLATPPPSATPPPAIIVIHEWWGLNDNIRSMARQLAAEGYQVLAVDLYEGKVTEERKGAADLMRAAMEQSRRLEEHLKQAYAFLEKERKAPRIGVVGWCFGGAWSLQTALLFPDDIDAAVIYYGRIITAPEALKTLNMPLLGIFGERDRGIPVAQVRKFDETLQSLDRKAAIHIYEGAEHAFANPSGTKYRKEAAEDAWAKTLEFFRLHLSP